MQFNKVDRNPYMGKRCLQGNDPASCFRHQVDQARAVYYIDSTEMPGQCQRAGAVEQNVGHLLQQ